MNRVGDGTVPLAIVIYVDGSFIKNKIAVKPIYITVRNLNSACLASPWLGGCWEWCQL